MRRVKAQDLEPGMAVHVGTREVVYGVYDHQYQVVTSVRRLILRGEFEGRWYHNEKRVAIGCGGEGWLVMPDCSVGIL